MAPYITSSVSLFDQQVASRAFVPSTETNRTRSQTRKCFLGLCCVTRSQLGLAKASLSRFQLCHPVLIGSCLTLAANRLAVAESHPHVACCCPFSGLAPLIKTRAAAHQNPPHHVLHLQTRCLQHPTGTASQPAHISALSFSALLPTFLLPRHDITTAARNRGISMSYARKYVGS